uniref:Uncharacterized protein n=1 Tax=Setaria digitata TaxID=48799 RepID=A0A915PI01_9BILA
MRQCVPWRGRRLSKKETDGSECRIEWCERAISGVLTAHLASCQSPTRPVACVASEGPIHIVRDFSNAPARDGSS